MKNTWLTDNIKSILWAAAIAILLRSCVAEPFHIPSGSMIPSMLVGDYLFVKKYSYGYSRYSFPFGLAPIKGRVFGREPKRGDIIVFKLPTDNSTNYIKRLIGLPGDKVQVRHGILYINDMPTERKFVGNYEDTHGTQPATFKVYEETLPNGVTHQIMEFSDNEPMDNTAAFHVPDGHYFMMGDNRDNSMDSRFPQIGYIPRENLLGNAWFIFYSNASPAYFFQVWNWGDWGRGLRFDRFFKGVSR